MIDVGLEGFGECKYAEMKKLLDGLVSFVEEKEQEIALVRQLVSFQEVIDEKEWHFGGKKGGEKKDSLYFITKFVV